MTDSTAKRTTLVELIVVLAIIGGLFALVYPVIQATRNPNGPDGLTIPTAPPNPANRIVHPTSLSIIAPVNWDQKLAGDSETPFLRIAARGTPGMRLKAYIIIRRREVPKDDELSEYSRLVFHGFPAYEVMDVEREFDDARSRYDLCVNRDGEWWLIQFYVADAIRKLPEPIRQYIETIEFPPKKAKPLRIPAE